MTRLIRSAATLAMLCSALPAFAQAPAVAPPSAVPPPAAAVPPPPPPLLDTWLPKPGIDLAGLDKVTTRLTTLTGRVGQPITFGTLSISVRSCIIRGPDQPADQAAFLDITDSRDPNFAFHGWMILSDPAVGVIEHPVYDIRLIGCRG